MVKEQRSSTSPITGSCRLLSVSCVLGYRLGESEEYRPDSWQVCLNHATGRRCSTSPPPSRSFRALESPILLPLYCTFSLTSFPLPPFSKKMYSIYRQLCGWGGGGGVELYCRPYSAGVLHSVSDQIQNLQNCFTTPNKYLGGGRGLRQINICRKVPLSME